jgi:hypothetical protein
MLQELKHRVGPRADAISDSFMTGIIISRYGSAYIKRQEAYLSRLEAQQAEVKKA